MCPTRSHSDFRRVAFRTSIRTTRSWMLLEKCELQKQTLLTTVFRIYYDSLNLYLWNYSHFTDSIFNMLTYIFSFVIEIIRFYKITIRILALAAPIWYQQHVKVKNMLIACALTFSLSSICTIFIVLHRTLKGCSNKYSLF